MRRGGRHAPSRGARAGTVLAGALVLSLAGCPGKPDDTGPGPGDTTVAVDLVGVPLVGAATTGSALVVADLDGTGADALLFFEQRYTDATGTAAAVGVHRGVPTSPTDLLETAVFRAWGGEGASIFGYPFTVLDDGRLLVADWASQCAGDGAVWLLDGPFTETGWHTACDSGPGWERIGAPEGVVGWGNAVVALPGGWAVGAPPSRQVHLSSGEILTGPESHGTALLAADLDGDGVDGLVVGAPEAGRVDAEGVEVAGTAGFGVALAAGDLDGDGRDDLLVGAWSDDGPEGTWWWFPDPGGTGTQIAEAGWIQPTGPAADVPGDLDGDGHLELLLAAPGEEDAARLYWGPFPSSRTTTWTGPAGDTTSGLGKAQTHGDLDGDGAVELLLAAPAAAFGGRPGIFVVEPPSAP